MGEGARRVQLRIFRAIEISTVIFGLLSLFFLYLFHPCIVNLVIFWAPFAVFIAFFVRIFWTSERSQPNEGTKKESSRQITENLVHRKDESNALITKSVVAEVKEAPPEHADGGEDGKTGTVENGASSSDKGKVVEAEDDHGQQRPPLYSEPSMIDLVLSDYLDDQKGKSQGEMEEAEEEEEEEAQDETNKAVEWTENDQKNFMDLGVIEIERNRRLENLIARRRARKLLKPQTVKGLPDMSAPEGTMAPLYITRGPTCDSPDGLEEIEGLQIPGSAPCMLESKRNPFDLPYEPHEEKPNLKEDSFNQEFLAAQQKEAMLCRHESFSLGNSFPMESMHDPNDREFHPFFILNGRKAYEKLGYPRTTRHSEKGNHDWLINNILSNEENRMSLLGINPVHIPGKERVVRWATNPEKIIGKEVNQNAKDMKNKGDEIDNHLHGGLPVKDDNGEPSSLSMDTGRERSRFGKHDVAVKQEIGQIFSPAYRNMLVDDSSNFPSPSACHTPTYSIASDLQVEVSEIGSPPIMDGIETESMACEGGMEQDIDSGDIHHMLKIEGSEAIPKDSDEANGMNKEVQSAAIKELDGESANPLHPNHQNSSTDVDSISSTKPDIAVDTLACPTTSDYNGAANMENQLPSTSTDVQHEENSEHTKKREELAVSSTNSLMNNANPFRPSLQEECLLEEGPVDSSASSSPTALAHSFDSDQNMHSRFINAKVMSDIQTPRGEPEVTVHPNVVSDHVQAKVHSIKHIKGEPIMTSEEEKSHRKDEKVEEAVGEDHLNPVETLSASEAVTSKSQLPQSDSVISHNEDERKDSHNSVEHDNIIAKSMKNTPSSEEVGSELHNDHGNLQSESPIKDSISKDVVQLVNPPSTSPRHERTS